MAMVPAICTQCGGKIHVDDTHDAGICDYCGTAFVTEKVILNYMNTINIDNATINLSNVDINNILLRAKSFEESKEREKAIEYYNKVLDIDINNIEALAGLKRMETVFIGLEPVSISLCHEIESLLKNGNKLEAIKKVCDKTHYSLASAKYFIENHQEGNWEEYDLEKVANNAGSCYIATAVYGSYNCPQVWTLRRYRDYTLSETWHGRAFIRAYYSISPTIVKRFGKSIWFNTFWKAALDRIVTKLNKKGVSDSPYIDREQ